MHRLLTIRLRWAFLIYAILDLLCIGMGMGVPIFAVLFGFLVGWYNARRIMGTVEQAEDVLRRIMYYALATAGFTFVVMLVMWGRAIVWLFDPEADFVQFGIPMILYDPRLSFIGWLVLMIFVSPFLQFLTALLGSHLTLLGRLKKSA